MIRRERAPISGDGRRHRFLFLGSEASCAAHGSCGKRPPPEASEGRSRRVGGGVARVAAHVGAGRLSSMGRGRPRRKKRSLSESERDRQTRW